MSEDIKFLETLEKKILLTINKIPLELKPMIGGVLVEIGRTLQETKKLHAEVAQTKLDLKLMLTEMKQTQDEMKKLNKNIEDTILAVKPTKLLLEVHDLLSRGSSGSNNRLMEAALNLGIK